LATAELNCRQGLKQQKRKKQNHLQLLEISLIILTNFDPFPVPHFCKMEDNVPPAPMVAPKSLLAVYL